MGPKHKNNGKVIFAVFFCFFDRVTLDHRRVGPSSLGEILTESLAQTEHCLSVQMIVLITRHWFSTYICTRIHFPLPLHAYIEVPPSQLGVMHTFTSQNEET